jgi:hypothetical protein
MVEIDNDRFLCKKPEAYYQKRILMAKYENNLINQDTYFNAMVMLSCKNPSPFQSSGKIDSPMKIPQMNFVKMF